MNSIKRIVIIGPAHPLRGGLASFNQRMALAFQEKGYEVYIYSFSLQYPSFLFPGTTQYSSEPAPDNLKIVSSINSINPISWLNTGLKIRRMKPDIVIFRYWLPFMAPALGSIARIIRGNKKTKVIALTDNVIPHEKRPGDVLLSRFFIKSCEGFISMSKSVLNQLKEFDKTKPRTYHAHPLYDNFGPAISREEALKNLGLDSKYRYILFFGFIRGYKGLDILLNAFASENLRKFPLKLIIAGEYYTDASPYELIIKEKGLNDHLEVHTHFIPDSSVVSYFCAADVVVQPYKNATQSGVTQIAYHFDKPMITTNVGGLSELVPHGKAGYVCEPNSEEINQAIFDFFDQNKMNEFSANVKKEKVKFAWEHFIESIEQLAEDIPGKKP